MKIQTFFILMLCFPAVFAGTCSVSVGSGNIATQTCTGGLFTVTPGASICYVNSVVSSPSGSTSGSVSYSNVLGTACIGGIFGCDK